MCLEARLLLWLYFPGSLSDSSRVLNRSTQPMWALTEGVWNNMVDSMSLLGFNTTSSLILFKGRKCLVFLFSWYTFCLIAFSTMEDLDVLYSFMFESIFAYWHSLYNLCIWMNSLAGQFSVASWHLKWHIPKQCFWFFLELLALPCLMLISILVKSVFSYFHLYMHVEHLDANILYHKFWALSLFLPILICFFILWHQSYILGFSWEL